MRATGVLPACLVVMSMLGAVVHASHTLAPAHKLVLQQWLSAHSAFRLATVEDCRCVDDVAKMRKRFGGEWRPVADYQPYVATGDFNGDGEADFAVVLVERADRGSFALLVFNGPFAEGPHEPAFIETGRDLARQGLFFGPPRQSFTDSCLAPSSRRAVSSCRRAERILSSTMSRRSDEAAEQGDEADEAGASDGASQLMPRCSTDMRVR
jgi:hypothetical protein